MTRACASILLLTLAAGCGGDVDKVVINEFQSWNTDTYENGGVYPDWIELYNRAGHDVDVSGWYMTDDLMNPTKWAFAKGTVIPKKGFLLVVADNDPEEGSLHAEFQLDQDGEDLGLYGPDDMDNPAIDQIAAFGLIDRDTSLARVPDGKGELEPTKNPTPGKSNE